MIFRKFLLAGGMALLSLSFGSASAADKAAPSFTEAQKEEMRGLIADYLNEHPEVIFESAKRYQEKQMNDLKEAAQKKIPEFKDFLNDPNSPSIGPKDAKVTVVEFFDFNCGYCKQAFADIKTLSEKHKDVRIIFKDFPILSPASKLASEWALAAHRQGKYFEFHKALMDHHGAYDEAVVKELASGLKLDMKKMEADAKSQAISDELEKNTRVAAELGIQGTPGFIVNGQSYPGYLGEEGLEDAIKQAAAAN